MRIFQNFLILALVVTFPGLLPAQPVVSNVLASQREDGNREVDISYDLSGGSGPMTVSILVSNDNGTTYVITPRPQYLSGAVGPGIYNGGGHAIVWNALADIPGNYWPLTRVRVTATETGPEPTPIPGYVYWTWLNGSDTRDQSGSYGTPGEADPANSPGSRDGSVSWTGASGALWLFGGYGYDGAGNPGWLNDLWKIELATNEWTWIKGDYTRDQRGNYGVLGEAAPANTPGGRRQAVSWVDTAGALRLFGGYGFASVGNEAYLNDLWKFDPATGQWTWMKGANVTNESGTYGTLGEAAASNTPGARCEAVSWTETTGALWLFGGSGVHGGVQNVRFNDLWKYDPATGDWAWMKGSDTHSQAGTYGTLGEADAANTPGARTGATSWTDASGALWLFGGEGFVSAENSGYLNDLWKYNPVTGQWTWIKGENTLNQPGIYGTPGEADPANTPGARLGAISWTDSAGTPWLLGGFGCDEAGAVGYLNDLWKFDPATGQWTWVKGAATINQSGTYGTLGLPAPANTPGARGHSTAFVDTLGTLCLFGGFGRDSAGKGGHLNDLWRLDLAVSPPTPTPSPTPQATQEPTPQPTPIPGNGCWTWMKGSDGFNQLGTYGTLGVAAPGNTPGARLDCVSWTDPSGALWLFGGLGYDSSNPGGMGDLNDLWKFDSTTNQWTWMKGSDIYGQSGMYGTQGVAGAANTPGGRRNAVSWDGDSGVFWLFGGTGSYGSGDYNEFNDLWNYDPATGYWTWMKGSNTSGQPTIYGTRGEPDPANTPGARWDAFTWGETSSTLWLFGGEGYFGEGDGTGRHNDLWKFDVATNQWTWMKGNNYYNFQGGVYGTLGVPDPANNPGPRINGVTWTDASGSLWLFGGWGLDSVGINGRLNDLWRYDPSTNNWTWIKGSNLRNQLGMYGTLGVADPANAPGAREMAVSWTDASGTFWLFGGFGYCSTGTGWLNDLWKYDPATNNWTWIKGSDTPTPPGVYGIMGVADPANTPGSRRSAVSWRRAPGALWLFGGDEYYPVGQVGRRNDLWRFE